MLSDDDRNTIAELAARLTGASLAGQARQDSLIANVQRRMADLEIPTLQAYLQHVRENPKENSELISALTIHTTAWFRENPHFVIFQEVLLTALEKNEVFKLWCAACSTGEEVYSFALLLEEFRRVHPKFEYQVLGTDIDPISVATAERGIYPEKSMNFHVRRYDQHLLIGSGPTQGLFTLSKEIRRRCVFRAHDLRNHIIKNEGPFHVIACRNVLIYFDAEGVHQVVSNLVHNMKPGGRLLIGHSESLAAHRFGLTQNGHSAYSKPEVKAVKASRMANKYRILCLTDSPTTLKYLEKNLGQMGFEGISASTVSEATSYLNFNVVDLVALDLDMKTNEGSRWIRNERKEGLRTPVVLLTEGLQDPEKLATRQSSLGAQGVIEKSNLTSETSKELILSLIRSKIDSEAQRAKPDARAMPEARPDIVLIGASTGGPQALAHILRTLPSDAPPIFITQHISAKFTRPLAERLSELSGLKVGHVEDHAPVEAGHIYMSYGDYHLGVESKKGRYFLRVENGPAFNGHRPSVDFLFNSALGIEGNVMAMLLTGMGRDGALGLRFLHQEGAFVIAQSEEDCVVYGMPREAIERGAVNFIGNLDEIRQVLLKAFQLQAKKSA